MAESLTPAQLRLQTAILDHLTKSCSKTGKESISFLRSHLRDEGWRGLGNLSDFETAVEALGFKLERVYTKDGRFIRVTFVTL